MSKRNSEVTQILVTKGNKTILAAGSDVTALAPGQLGIFAYEGGLSVAPADIAKQNVFFAVGLDRDGDGVTDDILKSRGSHIQTNKNINYVTYAPYQAPRNMKFILKDFVVEDEGVYGLKLEFKNDEITKTIGHAGFVQTFVVKAPCDTKDANAITKALVAELKFNDKKLVKFKILARTALTAAKDGLAKAAGAELTEAELDTVIAFHKGLADQTGIGFTNIEFETIPKAVTDFNLIHTKYYFPRETFVIPTLIRDSQCNGKIEITQTAQFEQGNGVDVKQLEYFVRGLDDGPYRVSELTILPDDKLFLTDGSAKYDVFAFSYEQKSLGGWLTYFNPEATLVAVPKDDTNTITALKALAEATSAVSDETPNLDLGA